MTAGGVGNEAAGAGAKRGSEQKSKEQDLGAIGAGGEQLRRRAGGTPRHKKGAS
jgi:hypothetical protein